jgi:predicted nucleic acid-binding protein
MIIIDSDILIWILRKNSTCIEQFKYVVETYNGQIFITPIQYMEIIAGIKENEIIKTELFLDSFGMINITKDSGKLAGSFLKKYQKSHNVQNADALIAAIVKTNGLKLWTLNRKHYPMMQKNEFLEFKSE